MFRLFFTGIRPNWPFALLFSQIFGPVSAHPACRQH